MNAKISSLSMMFASQRDIAFTNEEVYICPKCFGTRISSLKGYVTIMPNSEITFFCGKCHTPGLEYLKFEISYKLSRRLEMLFNRKDKVYV
jgi:hypothetical protein